MGMNAVLFHCVFKKYLCHTSVVICKNDVIAHSARLQSDSWRGDVNVGEEVSYKYVRAE